MRLKENWEEKQEQIIKQEASKMKANQDLQDQFKEWQEKGANSPSESDEFEQNSEETVFEPISLKQCEELQTIEEEETSAYDS